MDPTSTQSTEPGGGVSQEERPLTPEEEIAELQASEKVDAELEALKAALTRKGD